MSHGKVLCLALVMALALSCSVVGAKDRSYVSGNYFLTLGGQRCGFVKSVDGGAITAEVINEPAGPSYFVKKHIGSPRYEDFVVKGDNDKSREKSGTLTLLAPDLKTVLVQIKFYNMGIFRLQADKSEANADPIKRVQAELYVERMEFLPGPTVRASGSPQTSTSGTTSTPATTTTAPKVAPLPVAPKTLKRAG